MTAMLLWLVSRKPAPSCPSRATGVGEIVYNGSVSAPRRSLIFSLKPLSKQCYY